MADVKLLPLPDWMECLGEVSAAHIRDYTRANVEHHTEALRKDYADLRRDWDELEAVANRIRSGNEALRAEVETLKSDLSDYMQAANYQATRAERLAEALRWYVENDDTNEGQEGNEYWLAGRDRAIDALHPTAARESDHD